MQPGSLCALSATDKSVDLLGNKNKVNLDITVDIWQQKYGEFK